MVFVILPLATANTPTTPSYYLHESEILSDGGDIEIPDASAKLSTVIVTPGETVTEDPQWMRHVFFLKYPSLFLIFCISIL